MTGKLTLGFKKTYCEKCTSADGRAMRQGRPYCKSKYEYRNGHCVNFKPRNPVKGKVKADGNH